jgi:hypothetical protein
VTLPDDDVRWCARRRVYLGEGLRFEVLARDALLDAEAIDVTAEGLGLVVMHSVAGPAMPSVDEVVRVRYTGPGASGRWQEAVVRHIGRLCRGLRVLPRIGLALLPEATRPAGAERRRGARHACPDTLPAFATAAGLWFFRERLRFQVLAVGAGGMTLRSSQRNPPLLPQRSSTSTCTSRSAASSAFAAAWARCAGAAPPGRSRSAWPGASPRARCSARCRSTCWRRTSATPRRRCVLTASRSRASRGPSPSTTRRRAPTPCIRTSSAPASTSR